MVDKGGIIDCVCGVCVHACSARAYGVCAHMCLQACIDLQQTIHVHTQTHTPAVTQQSCLPSTGVPVQYSGIRNHPRLVDVTARWAASLSHQVPTAGRVATIVCIALVYHDTTIFV